MSCSTQNDLKIYDANLKITFVLNIQTISLRKIRLYQIIIPTLQSMSYITYDISSLFIIIFTSLAHSYYYVNGSGV